MSDHSEFALTVNGVVFNVKCWEYSDNTCDVELYGLAESQYLYYPGSSLVEVELNATVRTSHMIEDLTPLIEGTLEKI